MTWALEAMHARTVRTRRGPGIAGRSYIERGRPVLVLIQWGPGGGPRNVLIRRDDGQDVVRPFRGLRKDPEDRQ
jgi:acetyl esterase